ncbi:MAG: hypothetical protein RLZZ381_1772 [Cyanobacteriota bacterium]|jgi:hypothetical protein
MFCKNQLMSTRKSIICLLTCIFVAAILTSCTGESSSNEQCRYPDDLASDGSRCGDRAASVRPGGD